MAGFTEAALEKKLGELNNSQQSIQTLSLWLIHHRKHHKIIVQVWYKELRKAKPNRKLTFMYLANDIIQNSRKKGPEFTREYTSVLSKAFHHVHADAEEKTKTGLVRILTVWQERNIYDKNQIEEFQLAMCGRKSKTASHNQITEEIHPKKKKVDIVAAMKEESEMSAKSPPGDPPDAEELIKALLDLENAPSTDAAVREQIASLPPEVSDISLLEKVVDRNSGEKLSGQVHDACSLLNDYNSRLAEELEDRKQISRMLSDYTHAQREQLSNSEVKLEEFKSMLTKVNQVKDELKSHLQNLPDLTLLPSVTGGLAPLPSAGDLFSQP